MIKTIACVLCRQIMGRSGNTAIPLPTGTQRLLKLVQLQYRMWFTHYKKQTSLVKEGIYSDPR